jgi:uncharacterized membrane protein
VTFLLVLLHIGVAALWLGSMLYSLFVVQPAVPRAIEDPTRAEDVYRELGAGNRWKVIGLIAALALSGLGLVLVESGHSTGWWLAVGGKMVLLLAASVLFWWVSWRAWPRRVFALPAELPAEQARFRRVAITLTVLVGAAFVVGVAASHALA